MSAADKAQVLKALGIAHRSPNSNVLVSCPFHSDHDPSCSVHPGKGVYRCFSGRCGRRGKITDKAFVEALMNGAPLEEEAEARESLVLADMVSPAEVRAACKEFIKERRLQGVPLRPIDDVHDRLFGHLEVPDMTGQRHVWRRMFPGGARYLSEGEDGGRAAFWLRRPSRSGPCWVVEGPLDGWALVQAGAQAGVLAARTARVPDHIAWELRRYHVLLFADNDAGGFIGAKDSSETLKKFEIPHTRTLPSWEWKDAGEAWQHDPKALSAFVRDQEQRIDPDEVDYVKRWGRGGVPFLVLSTGVKDLDKALGGGYKPGAHVVQGLPGVGKSMWAVFQSYRAAMEGKSVIYLTTELTKEQMWARFASCLPGAPSWVALEQDPTRLPARLRPALERLAGRVKVLKNRGLYQLVRDAERADVVVVDYIQRLRGIATTDDGVNPAALGAAVGELSDLAQARGSVVLVVSSINRTSYERGGGMGASKQSGDIEFVAQSLCSIVPSGKGLNFQVDKNTRGESGMVVPVSVDRVHCRFGDLR